MGDFAVQTVIVDKKASELRGRYLDVFGSVPLVDVSFIETDFVSYANDVLLQNDSPKAEP
ncbi:MAG TPA: hypothetical protein DCK99_17690 [Blastocatellia bacterium]|jgi:hypothetical protein|nr:hypothetical protein [Blastocatellia bacterium]